MRPTIFEEFSDYRFDPHQFDTAAAYRRILTQLVRYLEYRKRLNICEPPEEILCYLKMLLKDEGLEKSLEEDD
ncbi:MAG: hypothetical protein KDC57_12710 [Saprospiraceae bacterium]|nr:hypothetical protein [Saprospiraceae bacterium]